MQQNNLDAGLDLAKQVLDAYPTIWRKVASEVKYFVLAYAEIDAGDETEFDDVAKNTLIACLPLNAGALPHFRRMISAACMHDIQDKQNWMGRTPMENAASLLSELDSKYISRIRAILRTDTEGLASYPAVTEERIEGYARAVNFSSYLKVCVNEMDMHSSDKSCDRLLSIVHDKLSIGLISNLHDNLLLPLRPVRFTRDGQPHLDA